MKRLFILSLLSVSLASGALSSSVTWTGNGGDTSFGNASNWNGGVPTAGSTINISGTGVTIGGISNTITGSHVVVGDNSTVTLNSNIGDYAPSIASYTVGNGSTLKMEATNGYNWDSKTIDVNLNETGKIIFWNQSHNLQLSHFNLTISIGVNTPINQVFSRELMYFSYSTVNNLTNGVNAAFDLDSLSLTIDGISGMTQVATVINGDLNNTLEGLSTDDLNAGEYRLVVTKGEHGDSTKVWVQYKVIPEPTSASLGVLGLGCLIWRRRR